MDPLRFTRPTITTIDYQSPLYINTVLHHTSVHPIHKQALAIFSDHHIDMAVYCLCLVNTSRPHHKQLRATIMSCIGLYCRVPAHSNGLNSIINTFCRAYNLGMFVRYKERQHWFIFLCFGYGKFTFHKVYIHCKFSTSVFK